MWKTMNISMVASGRSSTWSGIISPASNAKKLRIFRSWLPEGPQSGEQFPPLRTLKNYKYFDRSFRKVLNKVGEQFPLLGTLKNNEFFDCSFQKVLNMVGERQFPQLWSDMFGKITKVLPYIYNSKANLKWNKIISQLVSYFFSCVPKIA